MHQILSFAMFLSEDRVQWLKDNVKEIDSSHDALAQHRDKDAIIDHLASVDPHPKKAYTQWAVNRYKKGDFRQEDSERLGAALSNFHRYSGRLDHKDINHYKSLSHLEDAVEPHLGQAASNKEEKRQIKDEGADLVHSEGNVTIHKLKTEAGACAYGRGTKWCTAATETKNYFNHYNKDGPIHVINTGDPEKKYQVHFASNQFMDPKDRPVSPFKIAADHPETKNYKFFQDSHPAFAPDHVLNKNIQSDGNKGYYGAGEIRELLKNDKTGRLDSKSIEVLHRNGSYPEVYGHPNAPHSVISQGINKSAEARIHAASNPSLSDEHKDALIGHLDRGGAGSHAQRSQLADNLVRNNSLSEKHVSKLRENLSASGFRPQARKLLSHPSTSPDVLHAAAHDWRNDMESADAAINNPSTPAHTYESLHGQGVEIDAAMSLSKHTPEHVLHKLASHPNSFVADSARETLQKRGKQ